MMILQGVGRLLPYIGVCYANSPQKGGYTTPVPALDLTLFEVIWDPSINSLGAWKRMIHNNGHRGPHNLHDGNPQALLP